MNFPLISIIIPYYNHNQYIAQTLDSVLDDTYPKKEIVIINDGSTEQSDAGITSWIALHQNDIEVIYIKRENKGLTKTLNELIRIAQGEYIALIGSDDYFVNNTLTARIELLQKHPEKLMVIGDALVVDGSDNIKYQSGNFEFHQGNKNNYFTDQGLKYEIIRNWSVVGPVAMMHKSIFDLIGNYDEDLMVEDWDFYLRAVSKNLIVFFDQKVAAYRIHGSNTISNELKALNFRKSIMNTAKKNIHLFAFPYNFWLWRKYRRNKKKYEKLLEGNCNA